MHDLLKALTGHLGQRLAQGFKHEILNASYGVLNDPALGQASLFIVVVIVSLSIAQIAPSGYADTSLPSCSRTLSPDFHDGRVPYLTVFVLPSGMRTCTS